MATGIALPVVVVLALVIGGGSGDDHGEQHPTASGTALPAVSVPAPQETGATTVSTCAQVISALPATLAGQKLRLTTSDPPSPSIVAWGDPAIVLRCGVTKPAALNPTLTDQFFAVNGVLFLPGAASDPKTFTVVDRSVFVDVTVPASYPQPPLGPIADAVRKALPKAVCVQDAAQPTNVQCTRRS